MIGSEIRKKLRNGDCVFGTHITSLPNPNVIGMAATLNLDFAFFCTEHLPTDRNALTMLCRFYAKQCGVSPIVRVPSAQDTAAIAMTLDAGAEGIIVPYVETAEEVRQAASMIRHRPIKGRFQQELLAGERTLSPEMQDYIDNFNRDNYLILGIESVPAMENLETLITAAEVDGVFLGPHDISVSMGVPEDYDHPDFIDAVEDVVTRCRRHSVGVGIHLRLLKMQEDHLQRLLRAGMNLLINGTDIAHLCDALEEQNRALHTFIQHARKQSCLPPELPLAASQL